MKTTFTEEKKRAKKRPFLKNVALEESFQNPEGKILASTVWPLEQTSFIRTLKCPVSGFWVSSIQMVTEAQTFLRKVCF